MRSAIPFLLALAFGCSSSSDDPAYSAGGAAGSPANVGGTSGGGPVQTNAGATSSGGAVSGGGGTGGLAQGQGGRAGSAAGAGTGGNSAGNGGTSAGAGGRANGGSAGRSNGGAGSGGRANGGSAGASGGSAGGGSCVKNLACKLDPPPTTGDLYQDCVDRINQFLTQCACLPALARRKDGEACADQMAKYDADQNTAHAGTTANICQPRGSQNECPGYSSNNQVIGLCMQQMWDEGPPPTSSCTGDCYEEHGHFINMTDSSVTKVSCGFHTTATGKVWAVQNFTR